MPIYVGLAKRLFHITEVLFFYLVNSRQFKKWLALKGATFEPGKGGHLKVTLKGRHSVLPMHSGDLKKGLLDGIKKQLGLKQE